MRGVHNGFFWVKEVKTILGAKQVANADPAKMRFTGTPFFRWRKSTIPVFNAPPPLGIAAHFGRHQNSHRFHEPAFGKRFV